MKLHLNDDGRLRRRPLRRAMIWLAAALVLPVLGGCRVDHGPSHHEPLYEIEILSDPAADGDISFSPPATYIVSSASVTGSVLAGVDPAFSDAFRGFLSFPLRGFNGLPWHAHVDSATLEIFITSISEAFPGEGVPLLIDLVSYAPANLIASDYDRTLQPPLATLPLDIHAGDAGATVVIDVTGLVREAQHLGLSDFQLRFLLDDFALPGLVEIEDSLIATAPLLTVAYD